MKILLVIPPAPYMTSDRAFPPLGILYVSAWLKKKGRAVEIADLTGEKKWKEIFSQKLKSQKPEFIGFTATTPDMPIVLSLLKTARKILPKSKTVIGGPHAIIAPESLSMFDAVAAGEGFSAAEQAFKPGPGGIIRKPMLKDLDKMPLPDREAVDLKKYNYLLEGKKAANIISHMGCPFSCVFCCGRKSEYYRRVRFRSAKNVVSEMDLLNKKYGYEAFVFYDDEFNLSRPYALKLCSLLKKRNYVWRAPVRADLLDEKLAFEMKKAGCVEVTVGVESGSEKVLKLCGKKTTPGINSRARKICAEAGIKFKAFTIVGLPFSGPQDEKLTEKWLIENMPDSVDININTPYPSSLEYEEKEKYGLKFQNDFFKKPVSYKYDLKKYRAFCHNSILSPSQMLEIRADMLKNFSKAFRKRSGK